VLVHTAVADKFLPYIIDKLCEAGVTVHGDKAACKASKNVVPAAEDDYYREYGSLDIALKVVGDTAAAIAHINKYGTMHSDAIITKDSGNAKKFVSQVDSACVYVNASTRFSDGFEFGLGAEVGISTQKLHARGPMGLEALTSTKFIVEGEGQVRS